MADDVSLSRRVSEADDRKTRYLARKVEDFDQGSTLVFAAHPSPGVEAFHIPRAEGSTHVSTSARVPGSASVDSGREEASANTCVSEPNKAISGCTPAPELAESNVSWSVCCGGPTGPTSTSEPISWADELELERRDAQAQIEHYANSVANLEASIQSLKKDTDEARPSAYDVCEVFSPKRMCLEARMRGLKGGWSLDITVKDDVTSRTYDLRNPGDQKEVKRMIRRDKPSVLVVSPPCTVFSIDNQSEVHPTVKAQAIDMIRFSMELCEM